MSNIDNDFDIDNIYKNYNREYTVLYKKKFNIENDKYIFKFWTINDFILYCYDNKFFYHSVITHIKRYDHYGIFFYLYINRIDHNDNIYILTMEKNMDNKN